MQLRAHLQRSIGRQISLDEASTLTVGKLKILEAAARGAAQDLLAAQKQDSHISEGVGVPTGQYEVPELEELDKEDMMSLNGKQDEQIVEASKKLELDESHRPHKQVTTKSP